MRRATKRAAKWILPTLVATLLAIYYLTRIAASGCSGTGCDAYIPLSLLLPVLTLGVAAAAGIAAISDAQGRSRAWLVFLVACTLLAVAGPVAIVIAFRDSPDVVVALGTALVLIAPLSVATYNLFAARTE